MDKLPWYFKKNILRQDVPPFPPLYELNTEEKHHSNDSSNSGSEGLVN